MAGVPVSQGLAPWVILADGPGGLICARICPGQIVTAMVRHYLREHRARRRRRTFPGPSLHPYIAADLRALVLGGERELGAGLPRIQGPCPGGTASAGARCPAR